MNSQKRLLRYVLAHKGLLLLAGVCSLITLACLAGRGKLLQWFSSAGTGQLIPANIPAVKFLVNQGWLGHDPNFVFVFFLASASIVIGIPNALFTYIQDYLIASVTNRIGTDVRSEMYAHIQSMSMSYFHRSRIGDIISRMNSDVGLIQQSSSIIVQAIDGPIKLVGGLALMFSVSWKLSTLVILLVPLMGVGIDKLTHKIKQLTTTAQERVADMNVAIAESVRGIRIVKSFGTEDQEIKRFNKANNNSLAAALKFARRNSLVLPAIDLMGSVTIGIVIMLGGWMMVAKQISFPSLLTLAFYAFAVADAAKRFGRLNATYQQILGAAARIFQVLDTKSDLVEDPSGVELAGVQGRVEFDHVRFEYVPGEVVLEDLSFVMEPGEIVAIVGPSGAGKSTIADLIPRFFDVTSGRVMVEGQDVRNIKTTSLREHIAMVPQETILFSGTIADNIAYGKPGASREEIIEAAKSSNAHEFIIQCPNGYETELGEGGVGLSGGQKQRISIARALLKNPKILILDEATSSLDAASEGVVQEALDRLMQGRSTLIIAHRLSTVKNAHKILVMEKGKVVETGSFDGLVGSDGFFSQLYRTQFRAEDRDPVS